MAITVTKSDVKPFSNAKHPGNIFYQKLIKKYKQNYVLEKDAKAKNTIAQGVYNAIKSQNPEGRFLNCKDGSYTIKTEKDALKKIKTALNENKTAIEEHHRLRPWKGVRSISDELASSLRRNKVQAVQRLNSDEMRESKKKNLRRVENEKKRPATNESSRPITALDFKRLANLVKRLDSDDVKGIPKNNKSKSKK